MLLTVPIKQVKTKYGAAVSAESLYLTAGGGTIEEARERLEEGIMAWYNALKRAGVLEDALKRANLYIEGNETEGLKIKTVFESRPITDDGK